MIRYAQYHLFLGRIINSTRMHFYPDSITQLDNRHTYETSVSQVVFFLPTDRFQFKQEKKILHHQSSVIKGKHICTHCCCITSKIRFDISHEWPIHKQYFHTFTNKDLRLTCIKGFEPALSPALPPAQLLVGPLAC